MKYRTHTCGELSLKDENKTVELAGWINKKRSFGQLLFIDLRDRYGVTQIVFDTKEENLKDIFSLKKESVIHIQGNVKKRLEGQENKNMKTGEIEIEAKNYDVLSSSETIPIDLDDINNVTYENRLKYRYLDLRRKEVKEKIILRSKVAKATREFLDKHDFLEIETPFLTKSTPEGARDFLVPSRMNPKKFYALPQSPQIFKQILMVSGFDKYYQLPKCFRDEDLRADRQPEFTQIDIEMSFVEQSDVISLMNKFIKEIFSKIKNIDVDKIPQMTHHHAVNTYGTDRPDLRFDLKLQNLSEIFKDSKFKIFQDAINSTNKREEKGAIKAIVLNTDISNKKLKKYEDTVKEFKAKGLIILRYQEKELQGAILKFFTDKEIEDLKNKLQLKENDVVFIVSDPDLDIVNTSLGSLRNKLGKDFNLYDPTNNYSLLWVTDFPLFSWDEDNQRWASEHHPFTMPNPEDIKHLDTNPGKVKSWAYDLVINGLEAGGGSIRIHDPSLQEKIFSTLKITKKEQEEKFGFLLESFKYGVPPHGGIAFGFDRLVALFCNTNDIREVIAFPKNKNAQNPMDDSPNIVSKRQLDELHIQTKD